MTFSPSWYPVVDDSYPGAGDGTRIRAAHINDIVAKVGTLDGSGGAASYVTTWVGAFGPGFDELHASNLAMFTDTGLAWGPDYFLYQTPWGTWGTQQASNGDTIACAAYLQAGGAPDSTKETIWKLESGAWVEDTTQPVPPGTIVTTGAHEIPWQTGLFFVKDADGRLELANLQYNRAVFARMSAFHTVNIDGADEDDGGNPLGMVLVDTSGGPVTRTLPNATDTYPGRELVYINTNTSPVTVAPPAGVTLHGSGSIVGQYEWTAFVWTGTAWYARRGLLDAAHISYTPANSADWTTVPTTVAEALDTLAAALP